MENSSIGCQESRLPGTDICLFMDASDGGTFLHNQSIHIMLGKEGASVYCLLQTGISTKSWCIQYDH